MHFIAKRGSDIDSSTDSFNINRLITIDTVSVDDHSRLTFTKKLKKILPIMPKDIITVYQDRYNKDIIFTILHESNTTDGFTIKLKPSSICNMRKETNQEDSDLNSQIIKKDTLYDVNILIVDDEEDMLKLFEFLLHNEGYYNVQTFSDSKKAIKHFVELKKPDYYDLAIIDIRMPFINGIQLYQILKIINPDLKILFASALDAAYELTSLYHIPREDIIQKPCDNDKFVKVINDMVVNIFKSRKSTLK